MSAFEILLIVATLLCSMTAGLVFCFAVVVMPGIRVLPDHDYLRAFQVMDRTIQNNDPRFIAVWVGSALALIASLFLGWGELGALQRTVLLGATILYVGLVQIPTVLSSIPLNNAVQAVDLSTIDPKSARTHRAAFEKRWVFWNAFRTVVSRGKRNADGTARRDVTVPDAPEYITAEANEEGTRPRHISAGSERLAPGIRGIQRKMP